MIGIGRSRGQAARLRSRAKLVALSAVTALSFGALVLVVPAPAGAATTSVSIDMSKYIDGTTTPVPVARVGQGFLYGTNQDATAPSDGLLAPLALTSGRGGGALKVTGARGYAFGLSQFLPRYNMMRDEIERITQAPYNAVYDVLVSDLWGSDGFGNRPSPITEPCDQVGGTYDCTAWEDFLELLVDKLQTDGLLNSKIRFDIWNEPNVPGNGNVFWPRTTAQYYKMWETGVDKLRAEYPAAIIVGPSNPSYNSTKMASWLDQVKADGVVPDILNWHFSADPVADAANARALLAARGLSNVKLSMNEYLTRGQQYPAYSAWYLARLARSGISSATHAVWERTCCVDGLLDGTLTLQNGVATPTGEYWVYRANADLSGNLMSTTGSTSLDLVASRDDTTQTSTVLLGSSNGFTGTATVTVKGLNATPYLETAGALRAIVKRIPAYQDLQAPITVSDSVVSVSNHSATIDIPWADAQDAYQVVLQPVPTASGPIDGNVTSGANRFTYDANWGLTTSVADMYQGTENLSSTSGAQATLNFNGTQVLLYASKGPDQGKMSLSLDGGTPVTVDNYAAARDGDALAWTSPVLQAGAHTLTITNTGTKNAASTGFNIAVDRADIGTPGNVPDTEYHVDSNQTSGTNRFTYGANWGRTSNVADMYQGTANWSFTTGSQATVQFYGTQVQLFAAKAYNTGIMSLSLDGGAPVTVDTYSATRQADALVWTSPKVASGSHTLTITTTGTKNPASAGVDLALDRADIGTGTMGNAPDAAYDVDANQTSGVNKFTYSAGWGVTDGVGDMYYGTANWTQTAGRTATLTFDGTGVQLYAAKAFNVGKMTVSLDGGSPITIDTYSALRQAAALAWTSPHLAAGTHTLTIASTGTKNAASAGVEIALDRASISTD